MSGHEAIIQELHLKIENYARVLAAENTLRELQMKMESLQESLTVQALFNGNYTLFLVEITTYEIAIHYAQQYK